MITMRLWLWSVPNRRVPSHLENIKICRSCSLDFVLGHIAILIVCRLFSPNQDDDVFRG